MKTVYLHIGPHKTGSTFLQKVFIENREELFSQGIDYIDFGTSLFAHHSIVNMLRANSLKNGELRGRIEQSECDSILISSENFDSLSKQELEKLANEFSGINVKILLYYREPSVRLFSWWQEEVKHGSVLTYSEYVTSHYSRPFTSEVMNLNLVVSKYADVFGKSSLNVFDYEWCTSDLGILKPFKNILGLESKFTISSERINDGLDVASIETIRVLNSIAKSRGELNVYNVRDAFLKKWNKNSLLSEELIKLQLKDVKNIELGGTYIDKILKKYFLSSYLDCFVTSISETELGQVKTIPASTWMLNDRAIEIIKEIYKEIMR